MPSHSTIKCRVCLKQKKNPVLFYDKAKHIGLGVREHSNIHICSICYSAINKGRPLVLPTHLPIFKNNITRQKGLFTTHEYKKNDFILNYWGKKMWADERDMSSEYIW